MHDRHPLAALGHLAPVRRADLVALPVHRERRSCPSACTRYMPTLRMPRFGSRVITIGKRDVRAAVLRPALDERQLVEIDLVAAPDDLLARRRRRDFMRGGNFPTSSSRGSIDSLPSSPSGTLISSSSVMRVADLVELTRRRATCAMRRIEPNRLIADGKRRPRAVHAGSTCSNSSALPPPGCFITRSAISHSSRLTRHRLRDAHELAGLRRAASMNSRESVDGHGSTRDGSALGADVNRRDAERQRTPLDVGEAGARACARRAPPRSESSRPIAADTRTRCDVR